MKIGLFGGTFNPIQIGHLIVAQEVAETCDLRKVLFIPSAQPPHKLSSEVVSISHRFEMVKVAIAENQLFEISDVERQREGKSYTIDTIRHFREKYSSNEIHWIIGGDSIFELHSWKNPEAIIENCQLVVTTRPGFDLAKINPDYRDRVTFVPITDIAISSTAIRQRVRQGKSICYYVPIVVEHYIKEHRLYQT